MPLAFGDGSAVTPAGSSDGGVVLLRAVDVIGEILVECHAIELRCGLIIHGAPALASIERNDGAAVIAFDHSFRIVRCNPEIVIVAMRRSDRVKGVASVTGTMKADVKHVDIVQVLRIGVDVRVIPGALGKTVLLVDPRPVLAAVFGMKNTSFGRFDQSPDALGIHERHGDPDAPDTA